MFRMLTLIWAMGVLLFTSQAQAVAPMGESAGSKRTELVSEAQRSQTAHLDKPQTKSVHRRTVRTAPARAHRSRRSTKLAQAGSTQRKVKRARRTTKKRRRATKSVPVGKTISGLASYYWQPQRVASGGWFNPKAMTAAHKTLPFGTRVRVTNKRNGRSVDVTINDRGPYVAGRIIDLSDAAAGAIGMKRAGVVPVEVKVVGR